MGESKAELAANWRWRRRTGVDREEESKGSSVGQSLWLCSVLEDVDLHGETRV